MRHRIDLTVMSLALGLVLAGCASSDRPWWHDSPWWDTQYYDGQGDKKAPNGAYPVTVQPGDTVYSISRQHDVPVRAIIETNRIKAPFRIYPKQKLTIPARRYHVVAKGETVYGISQRYGVEASRLASANSIRAPYTIAVGQRLQIPGGAYSQPAARPGTRQVASTTPSPRAPARNQPSLPTAPKPQGGFVWPVKGKVVSRFGPKENGLHNDGINFAVPLGTKVQAAQSGVVAYSGNELKGYGNLLLVKHSNGWMTAYAHNQKLLVKRGDKVKKGDPIALSGSSGTVTTPQVHFEIRKGSKAVDPQTVIGS